MTRTLFFFTALAAMLMAMTAVLIRIELAYPGVSPLFLLETGFHDGPRFNATSVFHQLAGHLAVMLLGATMISAAREKGVAGGRVLTWIAIAVCSAGAVYTLAHAVIAALTHSTANGWTLYPPLDGLSNQSNWDTTPWISDALRIDPSRANLFILPAIWLLFTGAYVMLSTLKGLGKIGILAGLAIAALMFVLWNNGAVDDPGAVFMVSSVIIIPFVALSSVYMIDGGPTWLAALIGGLLAAVAATLTFTFIAEPPPPAYTLIDEAARYFLPMGFAWFALPALILFRTPTRLTGLAIIPIVFAIIGILALWLVPMTRLGLARMESQVVDYPIDFAADNLMMSIGVLLFLPLYLGIIVFLRRMRIRPDLS